MVHQEIQYSSQKSWFRCGLADFRGIKPGQREKSVQQLRFSGDKGKSVDRNRFRVGICERIKFWHIVCNSLSLLTKVKGR